jgi:hypothetical protein
MATVGASGCNSCDIGSGSVPVLGTGSYVFPQMLSKSCLHFIMSGVNRKPHENGELRAVVLIALSQFHMPVVWYGLER